MKCRFVVDMEVNPATMADAERAKVKFRQRTMRRRHPITGRVEESNVMDAYFPAGTEYECQLAWKFVLNGEAEPADDECAEVCGLTADDMHKLQRSRFKTEHIAPSDWDLYDKGVILGYDEKGPDGYAVGPAWEAYQKALSEVDDDEDDE